MRQRVVELFCSLEICGYFCPCSDDIPNIDTHSLNRKAHYKNSNRLPAIMFGRLSPFSTPYCAISLVSLSKVLRDLESYASKLHDWAMLRRGCAKCGGTVKILTSP